MPVAGVGVPIAGVVYPLLGCCGSCWGDILVANVGIPVAGVSDIEVPIAEVGVTVFLG